MEVKEFCRKKEINNISFDLYKGEILGFYGLQGSSRTELLETVFGIRQKDSGSITVFGETQKKASPKKSIANGVNLITEDRKLSGLFFNMNIGENIAIAHKQKISKGAFLNSNRMRSISGEYIKWLSVKCSGAGQMAGNLSGGNQQKVVISRCILTEPNIITLDEPTRGVDVGAKAEIYEILRELVRQGKSIIIISSELSEVALLCNRVLVMNGGRIRGELTDSVINEKSILEFAFSD